MNPRRDSSRAEEIFELLKDQKAKPSSRVLFQGLELLSSKYRNKDGEFYRSVRDLMEDTGLSAHSVIGGLRELANLGLITYRRGNPEDFLEARMRGKRPGHVITFRGQTTVAKFATVEAKKSL
jgi:DNA-binding transcriptional MocR family regulator